jgi:hypothetical protein
LASLYVSSYDRAEIRRLHRLELSEGMDSRQLDDFLDRLGRHRPKSTGERIDPPTGRSIKDRIRRWICPGT